MNRIMHLSLIGSAAMDIQMEVDLDWIERVMRQGDQYISLPLVVLKAPCRLLTEDVAAELQRRGVELPKVHGVRLSVLRVPKEQERIAEEWMFLSVQELRAAEHEERNFMQCAAYNRIISVPIDLARQLLTEADLLEPVLTP